MGFKPTILIKHAIHGYQFKIEVDREADALGIKVLIWEIQHVPVESQRLVFNGTEMNDSTKLTHLGIKDGDTIFLIEAKTEPVKEIETATTVDIQVPAPDNTDNADDDDDDDDDNNDEWQIKSVTKLSCWISAYLWFGFTVTLIATITCCLLSVIPFIFYTLGLIGVRKLSQCLLAFPIILTAIIGFGGLTLNILWFHNLWQLISMVICIMHIVIFSCLCKFVYKIAQLNQTQLNEVRASNCCCCK